MKSHLFFHDAIYGIKRGVFEFDQLVLARQILFQVGCNFVVKMLAILCEEYHVLLRFKCPLRENYRFRCVPEYREQHAPLLESAFCAGLEIFNNSGEKTFKIEIFRFLEMALLIEL